MLATVGGGGGRLWLYGCIATGQGQNNFILHARILHLSICVYQCIIEAAVATQPLLCTVSRCMPKMRFHVQYSASVGLKWSMVKTVCIIQTGMSVCIVHPSRFACQRIAIARSRSGCPVAAAVELTVYYYMVGMRSFKSLMNIC